MCGIIGYIGKRQAKEVLLKALHTLEYRGYDSAGIALLTHDKSDLVISKKAGKVDVLDQMCQAEQMESFCGMGHTRWATHGGVTDQNAHPHQIGAVTLIHNGIIENYRELTEKYHLESLLRTETDSEVAAAVLNHFYKGNPNEAIYRMIEELRGTYAFSIMFSDRPEEIYAIRNVSPIVASFCEEGAFLASDITALCPYTMTYFVLPEYLLMKMSKEGITLTDKQQKEILPNYCTIDWEIAGIDKQDYPFFMEKEIMEQPEAIRTTYQNRIVEGLPCFEQDHIPDHIFLECNKILIIGCGTAMHAGLVGKSLIQKFAGISVDVELASELIYDDYVYEPGTLAIIISQSGETIDTLEAGRAVKRHKVPLLSVVNVKGSTIARESDWVLYTNAGPEIAVASTKAYTVQLTALYLITCKLALIKKQFSKKQAQHFIRNLELAALNVEKILNQKERIHEMVKPILSAKDLFFLGRGLDYAMILEGSLKCKEITYIHSEAYASGELKHGTIALITEDTPVIVVATQEKILDKTISNAVEVRSRGAKVIGLTQKSNAEKWGKRCDDLFLLPDAEDEFAVFPATVTMQLMAYFISSDRGLDVDKPRNLAKVVTVE